MASVPERSEIDLEYRWSLNTVYESDEAWESDFVNLQERVSTLSEYASADLTDPEPLYEVLSLRYEIMRELSTLAAYARMRRDEDTRNQEYQAMVARSQSLQSKAASAASFIEPAIQQLDRDEVSNLIETNPELDTYEHYLDNILRLKPHTRSSEVEEVLADLSEVTGASGEVYQTLTNADMEFPSAEGPDGDSINITLSNFTTLQKNPDRDTRRRVYETFYDKWESVRNTVGRAYEKSVRSDVKHAQIRNYDSAREAALHSSNIPVSVYDTLLDTVQDNLDVLDEHAKLKQDALNVDELRGWDLYMPVAQSEGPDIEYETATEHVTEALGALGDDYQQRVADGISSRWVDVYENKGKQSGAYSGGTYDTQPFILMNYQDDISSMYTLAHELGHSIHSQLTSENQPYVYSKYDIFVAEVASTVNEVLLTNHLLETVDNLHFRRHVLNEYLERFRSTLFRQTMFASFEHRTHELIEAGEALTPDRLDEVYGDLKSTFYPSASFDDRMSREWMRIPHFYRAFYVYQYATGISAAVDIATRILDGSTDARDAYLEALKLGGSAYPVDVLETAGVDVTDAGYLESAIEEYERSLDEMKSLQ